MVLSWLFSISVARASLNWNHVGCEGVLRVSPGVSAEEDVTANFISFLSHSFDRWGEDLLALVSQRFGKPQGSPPPENTTEWMMVKEIISQLWSDRVDLERVKMWLREKGLELELSNTKRAIAEQEALPISHQLRFVRIPDRPFWVDSDWFTKGDINRNFRGRHEMTLGYEFEVLDVMLTHSQWYSINKKRFPPEAFERLDPEEIVSLPFDGKLVKMAPDHPMTGITGFMAALTANQLSEMRGLEEAYKVFIKSDGEVLATDLKSPEVETLRGYRIPTELEWLALTSETIEKISALPEEEQERIIMEYGWFDQPGSRLQQFQQKTMAVAQKKPILINNKKLYDLFGNAGEMVHPVEMLNQENGGRPRIHHTVREGGRTLITRGGTVLRPPLSSDPNDQRGDFAQHYHWTMNNHSYVGFRLVRTLFPE